eukprot:6868242-Prymnesium_polylepis.1
MCGMRGGFIIGTVLVGTHTRHQAAYDLSRTSPRRDSTPTTPPPAPPPERRSGASATSRPDPDNLGRAPALHRARIHTRILASAATNLSPALLASCWT